MNTTKNPNVRSYGQELVANSDGIANQATWRINGIPRNPVPTDFNTSIPVYTYLQSPNIGVTYKVLRTYLKVGS